MDDELTFKMPDPKTIPCLSCKWGIHNYLTSYCAKYHLKPKDVYFDNAKCPKYEKL